MNVIVGVRFTGVGRVYYFDPGELELKLGDKVIVETARGVEFGEVALEPREVADTGINKPLKKVIRKAAKRDFERMEKTESKEKEAMRVGEQKIRERDMDMKLVDVECTFDNSKIIFYFTAEGRVDFRELVKDLAAVFKTRIELRQIGVRDEAKKVGGLGPCGRPCCCSEFLGDFVPVSIKMAKEQNLSLSPTKISGLCGRLMCCLNYENEHYKEMRRKLPRVGTTVETPDGRADVVDVNALTGRVKAKLELPDGTFDIRPYMLEDLQFKRGEKPPQKQPGDKRGEKRDDKRGDKRDDKRGDRKDEKRGDRRDDKRGGRREEKRNEGAAPGESTDPEWKAPEGE